MWYGQSSRPAGLESPAGRALAKAKRQGLVPKAKTSGARSMIVSMRSCPCSDMLATTSTLQNEWP